MITLIYASDICFSSEMFMLTNVSERYEVASVLIEVVLRAMIMLPRDNDPDFRCVNVVSKVVAWGLLIFNMLVDVGMVITFSCMISL